MVTDTIIHPHSALNAPQFLIRTLCPPISLFKSLRNNYIKGYLKTASTTLRLAFRTEKKKNRSVHENYKILINQLMCTGTHTFVITFILLTETVRYKTALQATFQRSFLITQWQKMIRQISLHYTETLISLCFLISLSLLPIIIQVIKVYTYTTR
jgi:hypothetical protein